MTINRLGRRFLNNVAALAVAGFAGDAYADWPQYRGANHDGISADKIVRQWPAEGPRQLWKVPLNNGFSSFVVGRGQAFTLVTRSIDGLDQEVCVALNAETGKELWAAPLGKAKYQSGGDSGASDNRGGDGPRSTPSLDGDRLYVLSGYLVLFCFDASNGQAVWTKDLVKELGGKVVNWQNAASPLLEGDFIFVNCSAPDQALVAIRKQKGEVVWKGQNDALTHATPVAATILSQRQIIFFAQSGLVSVTPEDGKVLWRYPFPYKVSTAASPVVAGDIVYCSAGYDVGGGAVRISKNGASFTATELWRTPKKIVSHWSTPVYFQGHLYGLFSFKEFGTGPLKCVEVATGKEVWSKDGFGPGGVLLVDGRLVILSDKGELVLAEATPTAYQEVSRFDVLNGKCWNAPAISDGRIYARSTLEGVCVDVSAR